jgi:hypothetical protein
MALPTTMNWEMFKHARWIIFIPIAVAIFAKPAKADVLGEWTYSESKPCNGSVEVVENTITLHGPDGGCSGANWVKIETTIPEDVDTIDFLWSYQTYDGAFFDPPQVGVNGVYTQLTNQNNATGSGSISVQEGDVFTFRQYSIDTCCQPGHLTISGLSLWESITTSTTSTTTTTTTVPETTAPATVLTTTTVPETTTTSAPQTTLPELVPTTTLPPETVPTVVTVPPTVAPVPVTTTTVPETTTTSTTSTTVLETTTSTTVKPLVEISTTTSVSPTTSVQTTVAPTTTLPIAEVLQDISTSSNDEVAALATSPQVLATVSTEEAAQIFKALDVDELTDAQVDQLVEAVQNAPEAVREEFEDNVDIFKSGLDDYVPVGSTIPVGTRRTLVAVTAGITLAAAGTRIRR